jgi:hypothetical protein
MMGGAGCKCGFNKGPRMTQTRTIQNWNKTKTCNLSNEVYEVKTDTHGSHNYKSGTKVRLISGVDDNPIVGYHFIPGYVTVCRIDAEHAEFCGFKLEELELWTNNDESKEITNDQNN